MTGLVRPGSLPLPRLLRIATSNLLILSMGASYVTPVLAAGQADRQPLTRSAYENCQTGDPETFKRAVEAIALKALQREIQAVDYKGTIGDEWRRVGLDTILDKRIDLAVEEVRGETSWSGLAQSLINKEKAQALATDVAERVYRSDDVKKGIENLATGVGNEVGKSIEAGTKDAAGPTLDCLRSFLGPRYGVTVAGFVTAEAEKDYGLESGTGAEVSSGAVLRQSSKGLTGAAILLMRRQLANMATRIGRRLAGSILSRLVSVVAGGIGLVLIGKDIWELRNGVLPIIADEMKSPAAKDTVKAELAKAISEQIAEHVHDIAAKSAERIAGIWQDFRRAHARALSLAERNEGFREFLDTVKPDQLARLDEVTALIFNAGGEAGVLGALKTGSLNEAVRFLPEPAMTIARDMKSVDLALKWSDLAGDRLGKVMELEIYKRAAPGDFTRESLARILSLDNTAAASRLAAISREERRTLLELDNTRLSALARSLTESELATLAGYINGLDSAPRDRILAAVAAKPAKMQIFASGRVRHAVVASTDQAAAVEMLLREGASNPDDIARDFVAAWEGRISPVLLWDKHPLLIVSGGLLGVVLLLMLRRLFSRRRTAAA
jgi:hypothetical protein